MLLAHDRWRSPVGDVHVLSRDQVIVALEFGDPEYRLLPMARRRFSDGLDLVPGRNELGLAAKLQCYFAGDLQAFAELKIDAGGTNFQNRVWRLLTQIPPGQTRTYSQLAQLLGNSQASRAVGLANGANPISLIVPCHRVVGANGALTGYGGGVEVKRWLLRHESTKG